MGGLIKKDFMYIFKHPLMNFGIVALVILMTYRWNLYYMYSVMLGMYAMYFVINQLGLDERDRWFRTLNIFPMSALKIVSSYYIFNLILIILSIAVAFGMCFAFTGKVFENSIFCIATVSIELIYISIAIPIILKCGKETYRIFMVVVMMVPLIVLMVLGYFVMKFGFFKTGLLFESFNNVILASPFVAIVLSLISMKLSEVIYKNKEVA